MSSLNGQKYIEKPYPRTRILITDPLDAARKKNIVPAVFELDITGFRNESKSEKVNFLSRILFAVSRAVEKHPKFNSYRKGRNKIVEFKDCDICVMVERETGEGKMPLPYIVRNANKKSLKDIDDELNSAKSDNVNELYLHKNMRLYLSMPKVIRKLFWRFVLNNPYQFKKRLGSVALTALHGKGLGKWHFNPLSPYTLTIALGGIYKNEDGDDMMSITLCLDHDIIDGMDVMKFFQTLSKS